MSSEVAPSRIACFTLEFIKTVQRVPRSYGCGASHAMRAKSPTVYPNILAKVSMKEPQPEEQASLISSRRMVWFSTKMAFISCPPMSRMKDTSGETCLAPR